MSMLPAEKRLRYRTGTELLSVTLLDMEGRKVPGHVFDVSAGGMGFFVPREEDPDYGNGMAVWLCMASPLLTETVVASALIRRIEECDLGRLYGLEFLEGSRLIAKLPPTLASVFNRRRVQRLRLDAHRPVEVTIAGLAASSWHRVHGDLKGALRDISPRGLSFQVDSDSPARTALQQSVEVAFTPPGSTDVLVMRIRILHSSRLTDGLCYGAAFDPARTQGFVEKLKRLITLVRVHLIAPPQPADRDCAA